MRCSATPSIRPCQSSAASGYYLLITELLPSNWVPELHPHGAPGAASWAGLACLAESPMKMNLLAEEAQLRVM